MTSTLLACGGSSTRTLPHGSGGADEGFAAYAGMSTTSAGAAAVETGGAEHGARGGAKSGGSAGAPSLAGTKGESGGVEAGGRGGSLGHGGAPPRAGGNGGAHGGAAAAGGTAGALDAGGFTAQGGMLGTAGLSPGGRGPGGATGAGGASGVGGAATCMKSLADYCGVGGGSGTSSTSGCPLDWSQASNLTSLCAQHLRVTLYDCSDAQAVVLSGVDTSTTYYFDPQTHALTQVEAFGIRGPVCVGGPTPPLDVTTPSCTPTMPCTAGAGGQSP